MGHMRNPRRLLEDVRETWNRARTRWWVRGSVDLALVALVFTAVSAWQTRHLPKGTPAPDFSLRTLSGEQVRLSELRGKPVVLAIWAPWCGVCKMESSTLSGLRHMVGDSAHVLSVAVAYEDEEDVRRFAREQEVDYPVLLGGAELMGALKVEQFPTTFFVSSEGRIERASVGYTTRLGLLWRMWL
jgi:peroxiredoxin